MATLTTAGQVNVTNRPNQGSNPLRPVASPGTVSSPFKNNRSNSTMNGGLDAGIPTSMGNQNLPALPLAKVTSLRTGN